MRCLISLEKAIKTHFSSFWDPDIKAKAVLYISLCVKFDFWKETEKQRLFCREFAESKSPRKCNIWERQIVKAEKTHKGPKRVQYSPLRVP